MSSDGKLSIILEKRIDEHGNVYHIGKLRAPLVIDAKDGICFLVFTSTEGEEEIQIGSMTYTPKKERTPEFYKKPFSQ